MTQEQDAALTMALTAVLLHGAEPGSVTCDIQCG